MENKEKPLCLLVMPTKYYQEGRHINRMKYQLLTLMSHIQDIAEVKIIDLEVRFGYPSNEEEAADFLARVKRFFQLQNFVPHLIGISCYTSYDYLCTIDCCKIFAELYPDTILTVGGYHATALPDDFMNDELCIDYIVRGEGEYALRDIILNGTKGDLRIMNGTALNLEEEKPLQYQRYPYQVDDITISFSRGCPYTCSFCVQSDKFENKYRPKSMKQMQDQIHHLVNEVEVKRILLNDPFFGCKKEDAIEIINFLADNYPHITYWLETRLDVLTEDLIQHLSRLKLELHVGVESLAHDTILLMNKSKNPEHYVECFYQAIELSQKYHIQAKFGFIMNYPGESLESYRETIGHLKNAIGRYDELFFVFNCNPYTLFPGNELYNKRHQLVEERGYVLNNDNWWKTRQPDSAARSRTSIASKSINEAYQGNPRFWYDEITELKRKNNAKLHLESFSYFNKENITNFLKQYYKKGILSIWDEEIFPDQRVILDHFFHEINKIHFLYFNWDRFSGNLVRKAFENNFNRNTMRYGANFLSQFDQGSDLACVLESISTLMEFLKNEYNRNQQLEKKSQLIEFWGEHFDMSAGKVVARVRV